MNVKRIMTLVFAVLFCVSVLAGCGNSTDGLGKTTVSGGPDPAEVLLTVGEEAVTVGEFRYYVYNTAMMKAYSIDSSAAEDFGSFNWNQKTDDGQVLADEILATALDSVLRESIMLTKGKEKGIVQVEEDKKANDQMVDSYVLQNGEEAFLLTANAMAIDSVENYKSLANRMQAVEKAETEIAANLSGYMDESIDLSGWKSNDKVTAQHVLIMSESEKYEDPKATAEEVLEKAKAGEDFAALIAEYNEDPGATEAGYTFGPGEMVKEFEEAAFALECGEISDVVKTEYGYHIIKRLAGLAELQNYWVANAEYNLNEDLLAEISVEEIMKAASNAQRKLQEQNKSKTNTEAKQ